MKISVVLFSLVTVTMARPNLIRLTPQTIQASAGVSASTSSSPHNIVQIIPGLPLGPNSRILDTLEVRILNSGHDAISQRIQTNSKNATGITQIISAPAAAPLGPDGQVVDTIEVSLAKAEHAAAHKNERIRLANHDAETIEARAQAQQQVDSGPNSILMATRQAQSLASINPRGTSSISSAQIIESPELHAARIAQQQAIAARQSLRLHQPVLLGLDGQIFSTSPLIVA
ncbi:uncharacterized protein LOC131668692 [Phymastichus coffea]|uniref:uncharacterized protein LOC131668692 n=1 Tax=Phymastichus coffea TaxID=108790 RepID=UPI00273CA736|nr:uncharacterized protein LOC131668692 [Phymastichus coffea]